jgi:small subunit ribosomal protein S20
MAQGQATKIKKKKKSVLKRAANLLHPTMSAIDQSITKGVLHENTANRYKSRLNLAYNQLQAKGAAK